MARRPESVEGKSLISCDPNGPIAFVVTKIVVDKHAGEVSAGRLFSGTVRQGEEVWMNGAKRQIRLQQVSVYKGASRVAVDEIPAGNICGIVGLKDAFAGETVSSQPMEPFEAIKHIFEPVVTKSIEPKSPADLPKLVEVLKQVNKEDPSIFININEETGENLISGMGELHLEIIENRIKSEKHLEVITSKPIVVYRETVLRRSPEMEGKSPNKHNKFYMIVEPLEENIYKAIKAGELQEGRVKKKDSAFYDRLVELGMPMKEAKKYTDIYKGNVLFNDTKGGPHRRSHRINYGRIRTGNRCRSISKRTLHEIKSNTHRHKTARGRNTQRTSSSVPCNKRVYKRGDANSRGNNNGTTTSTADRSAIRIPWRHIKASTEQERTTIKHGTRRFKANSKSKTSGSRDVWLSIRLKVSNRR